MEPNRAPPRVYNDSPLFQALLSFLSPPPTAPLPNMPVRPANPPHTLPRPGKGYRYCPRCNNLNHVRKAACAHCSLPRPKPKHASTAASSSASAAHAARPKPRSVSGVRKRRRPATVVPPVTHTLPRPSHHHPPVPDNPPHVPDDPTPSLVSVHLGSALLHQFDPTALVDDTHHHLPEASSCATGVSDVTSKSVRQCSPLPHTDRDQHRWDPPWDAPIAAEELSLSNSFVHASRTSFAQPDTHAPSHPHQFVRNSASVDQVEHHSAHPHLQSHSAPQHNIYAQHHNNHHHHHHQQQQQMFVQEHVNEYPMVQDQVVQEQVVAHGQGTPLHMDPVAIAMGFDGMNGQLDESLVRSIGITDGEMAGPSEFVSQSPAPAVDDFAYPLLDGVLP